VLSHVPNSVDVILPLYRTEPYLIELLRRLRKSLQDVHLSIIAVDDLSPDRSVEIVQSIARDLELPLSICKHKRNRGQHQAVLTGLAQSHGEVSVVMDADLQDPPEMVVPLIEKLDPESPGIAWSLRDQGAAGWLDGISSWIFKHWIVRKLGSDLSPNFGMFFAMSAESRKALLQLPSENAYLPAMLISLRHPLHRLDYERGMTQGESGYTLRKRIELARKARRWVNSLKTR